MRLAKNFLLIWWPLAWGIILNYEVSGEVLWENYLNNQSDVVLQKVTENSASGFVIWKGEAFDSVNSAAIRYSYLAQFPTTGDALPDSVAFNTNTGELTVNVPKALDYEKTPLGEYGAAVILKITAYTDAWDGTSYPSPESTYEDHDLMLYVYIEDAPEPIHMTNVPTTITIAEDICLDEFGPDDCWVKIFQVLHEDEDLPTVDIAWFSLVMTDPYTDIFDMSDGSGFVWVYGPYLDYGVTSKYELYIMAEDDTYTENATLVVQLSDVNFPPSFLNLDNSVTTPESASIGTEIFTVTHEDKDKDTMTFSVLGDKHFSIDKRTGVVKVASALDYETSTSHNVSIKMSDGFHAETATLTVTITDVDEPPVFNVTSQTMRVNEEYAIGYNLPFFFKATDPETQLEPSGYQLTVNPEGAFIMSSSPSCITVAKHIDRENETTPLTYKLEITAADQGGLESTLYLLINIEDINDNEPVFDEEVYEIEVMRDTDVDTSVGKVLATDDDAGPNSEIFYSIAPTIGSDLCGIDTEGIITLADKPGRYEKGNISLTVLATDGGSPAMTGSASLVVTLTGEAPEPWIKTPAGIGIITAAIVIFLALIGGIIYGILRRKVPRAKVRKIKVAPKARTEIAQNGKQGPGNHASTAAVGQQAQKTMPDVETNSSLGYHTRTPSLTRADAETNAGDV